MAVVQVQRSAAKCITPAAVREQAVHRFSERVRVVGYEHHGARCSPDRFGERPHAALDAEIEVSDARQLARSVWQRIEIPAYPVDFGEVV